MAKEKRKNLIYLTSTLVVRRQPRRPNLRRVRGETDQNQATRRRPDNHKPQISQAGVAETSREERDRREGEIGEEDRRGRERVTTPPVENPSRCVFFFW